MIYRLGMMDVQIDEEDVHFLKEFTWAYHAGRLFREEKETGRRIFLHREIMGVHDDRQVRMIGKSRSLDFRKDNLRITP